MTTFSCPKCNSKETLPLNSSEERFECASCSKVFDNPEKFKGYRGGRLNGAFKTEWLGG